MPQVKIQGVLEVGGINLHVDIETHDGESDIYVTNVHPNCLVIPKERLMVDFLGLPSEVVLYLQAKGFSSLASLVDDHWQVKSNGFSPDIKDAVSVAIKQLRDKALVFDRVERFREPMGVVDLPKGKELVGGVSEGGDEKLDVDISSCDLNKAVEENLRRKEVNTLRDVVVRGRGRLMMVKGMDRKAIAKIELALMSAGASLPQ